MTPYLIVAAVVPALTGLGEAIRRHLHQQPLTRKTATRHERKTPPKWTYFDLIALAVLVTFSAIRYGVGTDFGVYERLYRTLYLSDWGYSIAQSSQETGFTVLLLITKSIFDHPQAIFWVTSALTVIPAYAAIRHTSSRPALAVALYILLAFYVTPFNIVRQGIAIALVFWATTALRHRRAWLVVVCAVAVTFHLTALLAIVIMWLARRWRPSPRSILVIFLAAGVAVVAVDRVGALGGYLARLNVRYEGYLGSPDAGLGTYLLIAAHLALLAYAHMLGRQDRAVAARTEWMVTYVLIGVALMIVGTEALLISRLALFFTIYLALLLPERVAASRHPGRHSVALIGIGLAYFVAYLYNYGGLLPYETYFA